MFNADTIMNTRSECAELTREELDVFLMGQIICTTHIDETIRVNTRHGEQERKRPGATYLHKGKKVIALTDVTLHFA